MQSEYNSNIVITELEFFKHKIDKWEVKITAIKNERLLANTNFSIILHNYNHQIAICLDIN